MSILEKLKDERVVDIAVYRNKLNLVEGCDGFYSMDLTKAGGQKLVDELQALVDHLDDNDAIAVWTKQLKHGVNSLVADIGGFMNKYGSVDYNFPTDEDVILVTFDKKYADTPLVDVTLTVLANMTRTHIPATALRIAYK
jgi:hypothetical protein